MGLGFHFLYLDENVADEHDGGGGVGGDDDSDDDDDQGQQLVDSETWDWDFTDHRV